MRPLDRANARPDCWRVYGVGYDVAAKLLIAAGDNPERLTSEAAFAHMCGVAPLAGVIGQDPTPPPQPRRQPPSQQRPLPRRDHPHVAPTSATRDYVARRRAEGKSTGEIVRILKRYIAREVFKQLRPLATS